jgi:hypothetical protein
LIAPLAATTHFSRNCSTWRNGLLLAQILDADGEDRPVRRGRIPEPLDVRLAERSLPREGLPGDGPRPIAVTATFGDVGQLQGHPGYFVDGDHGSSVLLRLEHHLDRT